MTKYYSKLITFFNPASINSIIVQVKILHLNLLKNRQITYQQNYMPLVDNI